MHQWNRVYGDILKYKKDMYKQEDIDEIEGVANALLKEFIEKGTPVVASAFDMRVVRAIKIQCKQIAPNNSYIDINSIDIKIIV